MEGLAEADEPPSSPSPSAFSSSSMLLVSERRRWLDGEGEAADSAGGGGEGGVGRCARRPPAGLDSSEGPARLEEEGGRLPAVERALEAGIAGALVEWKGVMGRRSRWGRQQAGG